jgi:hypothetical protein
MILVKHLPEKISCHSLILWFCLKTLKVLYFQTPPKSAKDSSMSKIYVNLFNILNNNFNSLRT